MKVELINYTPLTVCSKAIRKCWGSENKSDIFLEQKCMECGAIIRRHENKDAMCGNCGYDGVFTEDEYMCGEKDKALIERIGNKNKHGSTLEHLYYNFEIRGISRAVLQELARHRMASLSVKSTRYTLKELANERQFCNNDGSNPDIERARKYIVHTGVVNVDYAIIRSLEELRRCIKVGISNDKAKYCMPEAYKTDLSWSINARSLQNFLTLRTNKSALWEIRKLAYEIFNKLPEEHKYLFVDYIYKEEYEKKSVINAI